MIRLITILLLSLVCYVGIAQPVSQRSNGTSTVNDPRQMHTLNLFIPKYVDTLSVNLGIDSCGAIIFTYSGNKFWIRACNPKRWVEISTGGGYVTANNGLTDSSGRVILGGSLYKNTSINTNSYALSLTSSVYNSSNILSVTLSGTSNTETSAGYFNNTKIDDGGFASSSYGVTGNALGGVINAGVRGTALGDGLFSYGGDFEGVTAGVNALGASGIIASSTLGSSTTGNRAGIFVGQLAQSAAVFQTIIRVARSDGNLGSTGTGGGIEFTAPTTTTLDILTNELKSYWFDATDAAPTSHFDITGINSSVPEIFANFQPDGIVRVNDLADTLANKAYVRSLMGSGGGGNTIYTANDALISNRTVDLDGYYLTINSGGNEFLLLDPTTNNERSRISALNTTGNDNTATVGANTTATTALFNMSAKFNDNVKTVRIEGYADATLSYLELETDTVRIVSTLSGKTSGMVWTLANPANGSGYWGAVAGSGTVNSGTQYRIAYYATTGTAVSAASAITASRALVSDANGVPTHSATTATELGYVSGVTSAIQTQLATKVGLTGNETIAGDKTFSGVTTLAGTVQTGTGLLRVQNTGSVNPAGMTGVGFEFFVATGNSYLSSYNRTSSAYAPLVFYGSTIEFNGAATFINAASVPDVAYGAGWNGSFEVPTKNAIYDKIESLGGGSGTVTTVSVVSTNGFAGTVATATTTPAITISTTITGILKGNGTSISAATSGTDYSLGTSALATGIIKSTTTTGALTIAVAGDFPTLNQNTTGTAASLTTGRTIEMTGDVTWITPAFNGTANVTAAGTIANDAVTLAKMANMATASLIYRKTAGTGDPEVNTLATLKTDLGLTGTNSGDQTSIVGITGTTAQFNTALTDNDFATLAGAETLTNKTLTSPQINGAKLETSSTAGYVWTATNTAGAGSWQASAGGSQVLYYAAPLYEPNDSTIGLDDGDWGDITTSSDGIVWTIDNNAVTLAKMADMATASLIYRKTAGTGDPEVNTLATLKTDLGLTGTNSGDQTTIVGITGTVAEFNTALTSADFLTTATAVSVAQGGTGAATITGLLQGNGTSAITGISNSSTVGQVLRVTGASTYAWGALDLADADARTGILPIANIATGTPDGTKFVRDDGTLAVPSGGGNVTKVGTPVNNQIGVWTGNGTIEGSDNFQYDATALIIKSVASSSTPFQIFRSDGTTNIFKLNSNDGSGFLDMEGPGGSVLRFTGSDINAIFPLTSSNSANFYGYAAPAVPVTINAFASQTGNLLNVTSYGGTPGGMFMIDSVGKVGIGVTTGVSLTELSVISTSASDPRGILSGQYTTDAIGARIHFRKARGTYGTPTTIVTADVLGRLRFSGYDGTAFLQMGSIDVISTGTIGTNRVPTYMTFSTATDAATSVLTERMRIDAGGGVSFNGSFGTANQFLQTNGAGTPPTWVTVSGGGDMVLASVQTVTGAKTFGTIGGAVGKFILAGSTSGSTIVNAAAIAGSTTITFPGTTGTVALTSDLTIYAPLASPTFTGTVTIPTPFTLGAVSVLPTGTELNFVDGVTSAIQTQIDGKQASDADLTTIAGLTATTDNFIVSVSSAWASRTVAQVKTTLALNNVDNTSNVTERAATATLTNKTLTAPVIASIVNTGTLTLPTITGTVVQFAEASTASSATPTPTGDARVNWLYVTAQAAAAAFGAPSGTPANGNQIVIRIKDNATARALTYNAIYRASTDLALPSTTIISKTLYLGFVYNSTDSKWDLVSVLNNF